MSEPNFDGAAAKEPTVTVTPPPVAPAPAPEPRPEPVRAVAPEPAPEPVKPAAPVVDVEAFKRTQAELARELELARQHNARIRERSMLATMKAWGAIDIGDQNILALAPKDVDPETPEGLAKLDKWAKSEGKGLFRAQAPSQEAVLQATAERLKAPPTYRGPHDDKYAANLLAAVAGRVGNRGGR